MSTPLPPGFSPQQGVAPPLPPMSIMSNPNNQQQLSNSLPPMPPQTQGAPTQPPQHQYNRPPAGGRGGNYGGGRGNYSGRGNYNNNNSGRGNYNNNGGRGRGGNYPPNNYNNNMNNPQMQYPPRNELPPGQLPAFLPGAASMVEQLDRRLLVILRDGRHLVGILRTFDQFSNMVLQETSERRILVVDKDVNEPKVEDIDDADGQAQQSKPSSANTICYQTDIELGLFVVRGDNVVLLGEVGVEEEEQNNEQIRFVSLEEFEQLEDEEYRRKEEKDGEEEEPINWDFDQDLVA